MGALNIGAVVAGDGHAEGAGDSEWSDRQVGDQPQRAGHCRSTSGRIGSAYRSTRPTARYDASSRIRLVCVDTLAIRAYRQGPWRTTRHLRNSADRVAAGPHSAMRRLGIGCGDHAMVAC